MFKIYSYNYVIKLYFLLAVTKLAYKKPFCNPSEFGLHSLAIYRLILYIFQVSLFMLIDTYSRV